MNENARKWVEALRSGEFEQAEGYLRGGPNSYCCLGVACELYRRETGEGNWASESEGALFEMPYGGGSTASLPSRVADWLGLEDTSAYYESGDSLVDRNDSGASFAEIAAIIESEPRDLFKDA